ncbi:MAG TPA: type II CRISPR RNA-guided endonuclease Cas9 [Candidatus Faecousia intestinigallinarum]|nr:type II CRISPR RNA-guided endonuclease Cas9 [Candidatus Faecousia intestinigallinarum]
MEKGRGSYYLGLDIGTDSVGYAVTSQDYQLLKFRGEPMWGTHLFEAAKLAQERRAHRTARRSLDRKNQRLQLLNELFAGEICKIDPTFFLRRKESALFPEDAQQGVSIFENREAEQAYHRQYPTIHHLIVELMENSAPHDIRLVYLACAWLVTHRGHFLYEGEAVGTFSETYGALRSCAEENYGGLPWADNVKETEIQEILEAQKKAGEKGDALKKLPRAGKDEELGYNRTCFLDLMCGKKVEAGKLFGKTLDTDDAKISLDMEEEGFAAVLAKLGADGELLRAMRAVYDCALLSKEKGGKRYISEAKVEVYETHRRDLQWLKQFVRKYLNAKDYREIFREERKNKKDKEDKKCNYVAYTYHTEKGKHLKKAGKEEFYKFLKKKLKEAEGRLSEEDRAAYDQCLNRMDLGAFLTKQREPNNRVIPQQLYYEELEKILEQARGYLPLLAHMDEEERSVEEKIKAIFRFRVPYYVGPLNPASPHSWVVRKQKGKIYPWNFEDMVDQEESEQEFIRRMTNQCTYLPWEEVLPENSLLYSKFMVLNELNHLRLNGLPLPVAAKQALYQDLFVERSGKVRQKKIEEYLTSQGLMRAGDQLSGLDGGIQHTLQSYHAFRRMLASGCLTEKEVEDIIRHAAYSEDKGRMKRWLAANYPALTEDDRKYILGLRLKGFGRLSGALLTRIRETAADVPEEGRSILEIMWETNDDLMQILSQKYTFATEIQRLTEAYYQEHAKTLTERLDEMYVSNAVKRPILRAMDIVSDVVKVMGGSPARIFVEMARGRAPDEKKERKKSRKQQILDLYAHVQVAEIAQLRRELEEMGEAAESRLQSDKLFLYFTQLGRCMYTNEPINLSKLFDGAKLYDIDHIYPQSKVQDDSVLNNKVLVRSEVNGHKSDHYPIVDSIRIQQRGFWDMLLKNGMITQEKHYRLTRSTGFTEEEMRQFINRQLVETQQSSKVVAQLLREQYPESEVVYVKARLASAFRQEFNMLKSRAVNDLHHAKDAYLNIVAGNVYHEMFTRCPFHRDYNLNIKAMFEHAQTVRGVQVWRGGEDLAKVRGVMGKNAVHVTRYAFCRKGQLFDQQPKKAAPDLVPRKQGLNPERYGGYQKATASFYLLVSYRIGKQNDVIFLPIELMHAERIDADPEFKAAYIEAEIARLNSNKKPADIRVLRAVKINSVLELDGMRVTISEKTDKGQRILVAPLSQLTLGMEMERYVKRLERFQEKQEKQEKQKKQKKLGASILLDERYDHITAEENQALYDLLLEKLEHSVLRHSPNNIAEAIHRELFGQLEPVEQVYVLLQIISWLSGMRTCDLGKIGGSGTSGGRTLSAKLSNWKKDYRTVYLVDMPASGLFERRSENLLEGLQ